MRGVAARSCECTLSRHCHCLPVTVAAPVPAVVARLIPFVNAFPFGSMLAHSLLFHTHNCRSKHRHSENGHTSTREHEERWHRQSDCDAISHCASERRRRRTVAAIASHASSQTRPRRCSIVSVRILQCTLAGASRRRHSRAALSAPDGSVRVQRGLTRCGLDAPARQPAPGGQTFPHRPAGTRSAAATSAATAATRTGTGHREPHSHCGAVHARRGPRALVCGPDAGLSGALPRQRLQQRIAARAGSGSICIGGGLCALGTASASSGAGARSAQRACAAAAPTHAATAAARSTAMAATIANTSTAT